MQKRHFLLGLFALSGISTLAWLFFPATSRQSVGPLVWVERPTQYMAYPHPALQFEGDGVLVSRFIDTGGGASIELGASDLNLYVRSAHRPRSFRISHPAGSDLDYLVWKPVPDGPSPVRRYVQFAAPNATSQSRSDRPQTFELRWKTRSQSWGWVVVSALTLTLLVATGARVRRALGSVRRWVFRHRAPLMAGVVALASMISMWETGADGDESFTVSPARRMLSTGELTLDRFTYPHLPVYLQVGGTILHAVLRSVGGIAYHDPYSNQMYFDGRRVQGRPGSVFNAGSYPAITFDTALPWIRRGYALVCALLILAAFALAREVGSDRAAVLTAVTVALQPLLMKPQILPNVLGATIAVTTVYVFLRAPSTLPWTFFKGVLAGVLTAWKFNPMALPLLLGLLLLENAPSRRSSRLLIGLAGVPVGFVVIYPSLPWHLREFLADTAMSAHYYAWGGHPFFEADAPWAAILHGAFFRPGRPANYVVLVLALLGSLSLLARCREPAGRARAWTLLFPIVAMTWFLQGQMVQFGRNYTIPLALLCVLSGLGGDVLLRAAAERRLWHRLVASAIAMALLSLAVHRWRDIAPYWRTTTARQQAIAWIDRTAELGASVKMVENLQQLEGRLPDQSRFRVRWQDALDKDFDYLVVAEGERPGGDAEPFQTYTFEGRAVTGGEETYQVHWFARPRSSRAAVSRIPLASSAQR